MLVEVQVLDYGARYEFAPPSIWAVINLDEVVSAVPCESRRSERTMLIKFRDGSHLTVIGEPGDIVRSIRSERLKGADA